MNSDVIHHQKDRVNLCYDIVYKIYFYIDDYSTLCNFWTLSKTFYRDYMRKYNATYKHKYNTMYNNLFFFLSLLPDTDYRRINDHIGFYKIIVANNNSVLQNDLELLYRIYRLFFIKYFTIYKFHYGLHKHSERLASVLLMQGPEFIAELVYVKFCKNKIQIVPITNNRWTMLNKIVMISCRNNLYCSMELLSQVQKMDNLYKYFI
jgi:hypothetical protein